MNYEFKHHTVESPFISYQYKVKIFNNEYSIIKFIDTMYDGDFELHPFEDDVFRHEDLNVVLMKIGLSLDSVKKLYPEELI